MAQYIGVIFGANSGRIYAVVNPTDDRELENPKLLLIQNQDGEPMMIVRISQEEYAACVSQDDLDACVKKARGL